MKAALALLIGSAALAGCVSLPECAPVEFGEFAIGDEVRGKGPCGGGADCEFTGADKVTYVIMDDLVREKRVAAAELDPGLRKIAALNADNAAQIERSLCAGTLELVDDSGELYLQSAERPNPATGYPQRTIIDIRDGAMLVSVTSLPAV